MKKLDCPFSQIVVPKTKRIAQCNREEEQAVKDWYDYSHESNYPKNKNNATWSFRIENGEMIASNIIG